MARTPLSLPFSGKRLRGWRERAGVTQQSLADACGLSRFQISRWETGDNKPEPRSLTLLLRGLANVLGRPADGENALTLDDLLNVGAEE
jgi:transcriptional regulator with XRE-family HTH domain